MTQIEPIYVGSNAVEKFVQYCQTRQLNRFALVADTNTFGALGERVEMALKDAGCDVTSIVLEGREVIADEHYLLETLVRAPLGPCMFLAVGAGTLTDITRFISHRTGRSFISLPTAPSVDGFTSIGAPLVLNGVKQTVVCQPPVALFADLETLRNAPYQMIAAGYGDMIGKITSLADWRLGALLWNEPFDDSIFKRSQGAIESCISHTQEISRRSEAGVQLLMDALVESGLCMLDFGDSRPASGAEHHASHYWEMKLLQEQRPALLHGAKVGFALMHVARQYAKIRAVSRQEMLNRLEAAVLPERDQEAAIIRQGYGAMAEDVIRGHRPFLDLTPEGFDQVKRRIADRWDTIQQIAGDVPPPEQIAEHLRQVGAPTEGHELKLSEAEIKQGFQYGHYLRNRFTVLKLSRILDVPFP